MKTTIRKLQKRILGFLLIGCLSALIFSDTVFLMPVYAKEEPVTQEIVFTHDLHSHLESFSYKDEEELLSPIGGFARLKTFFDQEKEKAENTLILDAGDFSMGTLYQTAYETQASELRLLGLIGTDVTTLGNHEFDYRSEGLINMLDCAKASGDRLPLMTICNINRDNPTSEQKEVLDAFERFGMRDYVIIEKGGLRIAVIGVFGKESLSYAPTCVLSFDDPVEAVKKTVAEIENNEDADLIVCISHSGTSENPENSEDEILAKEVPQLDLIISGHSHTILDEPIVYGNTAVVSCGEYGVRAGKVILKQENKGTWSVEDYQLIKMDESIPEDTQALSAISQMGESINNNYLKQFGYTKDQILTTNSYEFDSVADVYDKNTESTLGNLLADSYIYTVEQADEFDGIPVDVAVVPSGIIRDSFYKGDITVSDVFNVFSLGIGKDKIAGYPLISVYLTGKELKTVAEIDASVSPIMSTARLYTSGLNYEFNTKRIILNKVTDCYLTDQSGDRKEIEDDRLYRVVVDLYSGQMLSAVTDISKGILKIVPKDKEGNLITNLEDCILYTNGHEIKNWTAVAKYMESFDNHEIPSYYQETHDRKIVRSDFRISDYFLHLNAISVILYVVVILILLLLGLVTRKMIKRIQRKRKK
ncbi:MAG: bifunctional UDP-sugar hydrolase/5'-nucleotidase [Lachnospiraceae bacterium]|nr:bifunctional UDP-sugar hydrolase/5'-nucleotidase [Lachnospiraceae bacterium]